jgi:hypothetical protein
MTAVSHGTWAKRMADVREALRCGLRLSRNRSDLARGKPYRLEAKEPGRRRPVQAASRRSRARVARALTGLRRAGSGFSKPSWLGVTWARRIRRESFRRTHDALAREVHVVLDFQSVA